MPYSSTWHPAPYIHIYEYRAAGNPNVPEFQCEALHSRFPKSAHKLGKFLEENNDARRMDKADMHFIFTDHNEESDLLPINVQELTSMHLQDLITAVTNPEIHFVTTRIDFVGYDLLTYECLQIIDPSSRSEEEKIRWFHTVAQICPVLACALIDKVMVNTAVSVDSIADMWRRVIPVTTLFFDIDQGHYPVAFDKNEMDQEVYRLLKNPLSWIEEINTNSPRLVPEANRVFDWIAAGQYALTFAFPDATMVRTTSSKEIELIRQIYDYTEFEG